MCLEEGQHIHFDGSAVRLFSPHSSEHGQPVGMSVDVCERSPRIALTLMSSKPRATRSATAAGGGIRWMVIGGSGFVVDSARTGDATNAPTVEAEIASHDGTYWQGAAATGRSAGIVWGRLCFAG